MLLGTGACKDPEAMTLTAVSYPICLSGVLTPRPSPGEHCQLQLNKEFSMCHEGRSTGIPAHLSMELQYSLIAGRLVSDILPMLMWIFELGK